MRIMGVATRSLGATSTLAGAMPNCTIPFIRQQSPESPCGHPARFAVSTANSWAPAGPFVTHRIMVGAPLAGALTSYHKFGVKR